MIKKFISRHSCSDLFFKTIREYFTTKHTSSCDAYGTMDFIAKMNR